MRGLLEAGIDIDIFSMYPLDRRLWRFVPDILSERFLPRGKVHHISLVRDFRFAKGWTLGKLGIFLRDSTAVSVSAARSGIEPLVKSAYVLLKAWIWAKQYPSCYDQILAYWGNYAATCAYGFHRLVDRRITFSMFLHAGADLYDNQVYLREKLLHADNIIVVCDFNRQFIRKIYPDIFHLISEKIHLHHLGLDFGEFPYEPDGRPLQRIVAVGRFDRTKGFDYLLRAVRELMLRGADVELELVGDGDQADFLRQLAQDLGIADRVRFRGWLTIDEVKVVMKQGTVLAHPSTGLGDAVPTVIKEAMAIGTPVVASAVAGIPELLDGGRCGILVQPMNVPLLADALQVLLRDLGLRRKYAFAARKFVEENFDLWKNGKRLAGLLYANQHNNATFSQDSAQWHLDKGGPRKG